MRFIETRVGFVICWLAIGLSACGVAYALSEAIDLPVLYESFTTGQCVAVDDPSGVYSCENPPTRYYHEWVE